MENGDSFAVGLRDVVPGFSQIPKVKEKKEKRKENKVPTLAFFPVPFSCSTFIDNAAHRSPFKVDGSVRSHGIVQPPPQSPLGHLSPLQNLPLVTLYSP